jgi:hypothetical protein
MSVKKLKEDVKVVAKDVGDIAKAGAKDMGEKAKAGAKDMGEKAKAGAIDATVKTEKFLKDKLEEDLKKKAVRKEKDVDRTILGH